MKLAIVILLNILMTGIAPAQSPAGARNQIIVVPPGWSRTDLGGTATVLIPDSDRDSVQVLFQGFPSEGSLHDTFKRDYDKMISGRKAQTSGQPLALTSLQGAPMMTASFHIESPGEAPAWVVLVEAATPGTIEKILMTAKTQESFTRNLAALRQITESWQFANMPASGGGASARQSTAPGGVAGDLPPGRLEGVYSGYKFVYRTTIGAMVQRSAQTDFFTFFRDGTVFNGLPDHGLERFNMAQACSNGRQDFCGVYQLEGERITIVLDRGKYRQVGRYTPDQIQIADRRYILQGDPGKTPSRSLDGIYVRADARPGEDLARRFIRFTRDGRFQDQGLVTTIAGTDITGGNLRFERQGGTGTYRLSNFTLTLRYSDGYERGLPILISPDDQDQPLPAGIFVNTYTLIRR